ncbi:MAG: apolipoprotein N-acyltransferase [Rhodospirillales bacterium]|nr:apolipoprotein N-acyltransferase [Rhodospirillales bacterium]
MERLKNKVLTLQSWKLRFLLFLLGCFAGGALPPFHLVFLLIPGFTVILWRLEAAASKKSAFALGWWFGMGFFAVGLYWIAHSFFVDAETYGWMAPFAILGLAAGMAIFIGLSTLFCWLIEPRGLAGLLNLAASWTVFEWVRGWIFTGFPWNLLGTVWTFSDGMIQSVALFGTFGLTLFTVLAAASPALLASGKKYSAVAPFALLLIFWAAGEARIAGEETTYVEGIKLRIVQPNIAQEDKWKREFRQEHFLKLIYMSADPRGDEKNPPTHIIWPETAVPFFLANDKVRLGHIGSIVPKNGYLISGAPSATAKGETPFKIFNSVVVVNDKGKLEARYDKHHLVPFGEYVPFRSLLTWKNFNIGGTDFTSGVGPRTLNLLSLPPFSPLICYEVIFPGELYDPKNRPSWLLNVTNDAWFGKSMGPYQHLASAKLRAVEEGIPLIRAANTGISAVFDGYGRLTAHLPLGKQAVLDSGLPQALEVLTPYGHYHNWMLAIVVVFAFSAAFGAHRLSLRN